MAVFLEVDKMRVIEKRDDGSGVIEIPVAVEARLDLAKTKSQKAGEFVMGIDVFRQIAASFGARGGPKPVYAGHISSAARRTTPAWGFIEAAWVENGKLWNRVDLNAEAFDAIVTRRGFRSASIEIDLNHETPTGTVKGWSQGGLAITNTPALDVQYVAAEAGESQTMSVSTGALYGAEDRKMETVTLEALQADKIQLEATVRANEAKIREQGDALVSLQRKNDEIAQDRDAVRLELAQVRVSLTEKTSAVSLMSSQIDTLTAERDAAVKKSVTLEREASSKSVRSLILEATRNGVDSSYFEGSEGNEADWLRQRFASLDSFKQFVSALPKRKGAVTVNLGKSDDDTETIPSDRAAALRRSGLDPRYATVRTSDDLAALRDNK